MLIIQAQRFNGIMRPEQNYSMTLTPKERPWYASSQKGEYRVLPSDDEESLWTACGSKLIPIPS
jgi:hypothetical protein